MAMTVLEPVLAWATSGRPLLTHYAGPVGSSVRLPILPACDYTAQAPVQKRPATQCRARVASIKQSWRWRCWMWKSWAGIVCSCEAGWMYCQFSEMPLETSYSREMNIQFMGNSSGGHSCSQHTNCILQTDVTISFAYCK